LFTLAGLAYIGTYTARYYEVPVAAAIALAAAVVGGIFLCFHIRDSVAEKAEKRRQPYANLTVTSPVNLLVLQSADDEVSIFFKKFQATFRWIIGISSSAKRTSSRVPERLESFMPIPLATLLFLFGVVLAVAGIDVVYILLVFTIMALVLVAYFLPSAAAALWDSISTTGASAFWPIYSAFQSGNLIDPFFVIVRVMDRPQVQAGYGAVVVFRAVPLEKSFNFFGRLARRSWLHTAICESPRCAQDIVEWLRAIENNPQDRPAP
jgi:hypothetical protein